MATAVKQLMADSSMDLTAIQMVSGQLALIGATLEEITSPTKVDINKDMEIKGPWALGAGGHQPELLQA